MPGRVRMSQFLLVHGGFHGAWCWRKTVAELEKRGHRAKAIDLPGQGEDQTPLTKVTLGTMVDKIVVEMAGLPGQVVLVGHSLGGIAISVTGETVPERWVAENRTLLEVKVTFGGDHHLSSDIHRS